MLEAALFLTLFKGPWMWLGMAGWASLFFLFLKERTNRLCAIFFFAAFFHSSGYFANPLFTLKHLHIALALAAVAELLREGGFGVWVKGARERALWLAYGIWALAMLAGSMPFSLKAVKVSFNWALVLVFATYVVGALLRDPQAIKKALASFILGAVAQCIFGYYNLLQRTTVLEASIPANHHLSLLLCFALFYALWLYLTEKQDSRKAVLFFALLFMMLTLGLTLSRTGWLSFLFNLAIFIKMIVWNRDSPRSAKLRLGLVCGALLLVVDICMTRLDFVERLFSIEWLINGQFIRKHGDFFGRFRPDLMQQVWDGSALQFVFGRGFQHWITDIHSLYLALFCASGIIGLGLFLTLIVGLSARLVRLVKATPEWHDRIFYLSALGALSSWILTSIMATLFLQFYVGIALSVAVFAAAYVKQGAVERQ